MHPALPPASRRLTLATPRTRRAFGRIGSSYVRKEDYDNGIKYLQKSLTEHRTPDVLAKLKDAEKQAAEKARLAYIDPAKADAAREEGNTAFRNGDFATAVTHYAESIKRNPEDPRGYTNRAAAYNKLMALPEALKDAEKAIEIDPAFGESAAGRESRVQGERVADLLNPAPTLLDAVKGYIRKSHVLFAMKEFDKALAAIETVRGLAFLLSPSSARAPATLTDESPRTRRTNRQQRRTRRRRTRRRLPSSSLR